MNSFSILFRCTERVREGADCVVGCPQELHRIEEELSEN